MIIHPELLREYCVTPQDVLKLEACIKHGSYVLAGAALGINESTVRKRMIAVAERAALKGIAPDRDLLYPLPASQLITGVSTLQKSPNGNLQWVKTKVSEEARIRMLQECIESLTQDLPRLEPRAHGPCYPSDNLMAIYPIGDPHFGMMAWGEESGEDWDLKIAEGKFLSVFDRLVKTAMPCKRAVIISLGDTFHTDNVMNMTARSGHHLDVDGRLQKTIRVGYKILRRMIESALDHHEVVYVKMLKGNHDDVGAMHLSEALYNIYAHEPRVIVDRSPSVFYYIRHGAVLIGAHHGHTCRHEKLAGVMATDRPRDWGETEFRYWLTGHIHKNMKERDELQGASVESFGTVTARDAWANESGYRSVRDMKCLLMHRRFGEVERYTINVAQTLEDHNDASIPYVFHTAN